MVSGPQPEFLGKRKTEWVHGIDYDEANQHLFEHIAAFYNRNRKHAALGYHALNWQTPAAFEESFSFQTLTEAAEGSLGMSVGDRFHSSRRH